MLPDYDQLSLVPLPGRGLLVEEPVPIDGSVAGRAFLGDELVEEEVAGGARIYVPLLDGTDRVGVLGFTSDSCDEDDRRLAKRFDVELPDLYAAMDRAVAGQFDEEHFVTVQMAHLDVGSGLLRWVNAGHPHPLLLRGGRVIRALDSPTTLPLGFGGADPQVSEERLEASDRVLFFTDGIVEEHISGGELFGEDRLVELIEEVSAEGGPVQETVRRLSHALKRARGEVTNDDATLFLVEWRGGSPDRLARVDATRS